MARLKVTHTKIIFSLDLASVYRRTCVAKKWFTSIDSKIKNKKRQSHQP